MRRHAHLILLGLVLVLGAALRVYHLSSVPSELIVDELDLYNSAYSIATTGHDIDGTLQPFLYCSLTRNPPIYAIAGYASTLVLGKNPFGLRFPAVIFGLISILALYGIARELTRRRDVALTAALTMAVSPIFIQFSRVAWEPSSELPFLLSGLYVLMRAFRRADDAGSPERVGFGGIALGAILLGLTSYTYMAGWFYAVVLGGSLALFFFSRTRTPQSIAKALGGVAIWFVVSAPALWEWFFDYHTMNRTRGLSTFANGITPAALHAFFGNYIVHFRWSYLVTTGDPLSGQTWRYLDGFGAFYWWVIALAVLGAAVSFRYVRARWGFPWIWVWLLAYPLGGALTNEGAPNAPRTLAGAPVFCLLAGIGLALLLDLAANIPRERIARIAGIAIRALFGVAVALSVTLFSIFYFTRFVHMNSNAWDSGTAQMFGIIRAHAADYDRACFAVLPAWYGTDTYARYYLDDLPTRLHVIPYYLDPECALPGTMLVMDEQHLQTGKGIVPLGAAYSVDGGNPWAYVAGRPRR